MSGGWKESPLADLLAEDLTNGVSPASDGQIPGNVLTLTAITQGAFDITAQRPALFAGEVPDSKHVREGDLLIARGNGSRELVGVMACAEQIRDPVVFPDTMIAARIRSDVVDRRYLLHLWNSAILRPSILSVARTTNGIHKVNQENLGGIQIPLPPSIAEQRRIADVIDKADVIRCKRKDAIALTNELLRSTFLDMFGDPIANPMGWEMRPLHSFLSFLTSGSRGWAQHYAQDGDLFIRIQNVKDDVLDLSEIVLVNTPDSAEARRTRVQSGDVLLSITADLGRTAVVPNDIGPAYVSQHLAILRLVGIEPEYLSSFLNSPGGKRQFDSADRHGVKAGLNFDDIRNISVVLPDRSTQIEFAKRKAAIRSLARRLIEGTSTADVLVSSIQSQTIHLPSSRSQTTRLPTGSR